MLCDVASIFVVRTLIVSQAYTMVLTLIDITRIRIFMYSIPCRHFTCPFISSPFEPKVSCELKLGLPLHTQVLLYKSVVQLGKHVTDMLSS